MAKLRIIFMGTPELAATSLNALLADDSFQVIAVVTQPDRPKGRDLKLQPSPVKETALRANIPVLQPQRARDEKFVAELQQLAPDLIAVAAFGQILPQAILDLPRLGCLNVHTSLLPKYRGASPIQSAILYGESETGVTIMKMEVGLDTGAILTQEKTSINREDNAQTLHDRLANMGAGLLVRTIHEYAAGRIQPRAQPMEGVSHVPKIKKEAGRIDWTQSAVAIWNRVRAFTPWPGAFTHYGNPPGLLKIWQAEPAEVTGKPGCILGADRNGIIVGCGNGSLRILNLQREGGKRLAAQDFLAGSPFKAGDTLGCSDANPV